MLTQNRQNRTFHFALILLLNISFMPASSSAESLSLTPSGIEATLTSLKSDPYIVATWENIREQGQSKTKPSTIGESQSLEHEFLAALREQSDLFVGKPSGELSVDQLKVFDPRQVSDAETQKRLQDLGCSSRHRSDYQTGVRQAFSGQHQSETTQALSKRGLRCGELLQEFNQTQSQTDAERYACCHMGFAVGQALVAPAYEKLHAQGTDSSDQSNAQSRCVDEIDKAFLFAKDLCSDPDGCMAMTNEDTVVFGGCFSFGFTKGNEYCRNHGDKFAAAFSIIENELYGSQCDSETLVPDRKEGREVAGSRAISEIDRATEAGP